MTSSKLKISSLDLTKMDIKPQDTVQPIARSAQGAFLTHMISESKVMAENKILKSELEKAKDIIPVKLIAPELIKPSKFSNRLEINFESADFEELKKSISESSVNVQPIKVRETPGGEGDYEIVYGHRRHRACLELGIPVAAIVIKEMTEKQLFCEMEKENQFRKNVSPYEQGLLYKKVLDSGLYDSALSLSKDIGVEQAIISKSVSLINLPIEIAKSFPDVTAIQFNWITPLKKAYEKASSKVINEALEISKDVIRPAAVDIYKRLVASANKKDGRVSPMKSKLKMLNDRSVRISIDFLPMEIESRNKILKKINSFIENLTNDTAV
jgi:ParB family chromosome partitioning protein